MEVPPTLRHLVTIMLVSGTVMLTGLGAARLWDRDEPRNAGCAREMLLRGDWIVPVFNGELRAHKPVLLYWCLMATYSLFGESEFTARLPSALCAMGAALATYGIGRRLFSPTVGLWSAIVLSTSLMFGVAGRAATPDSLLIFCVTFTMLIYVLFGFPIRDGNFFPRSLWPAALLYGAMGVAVLAKGPVGLVLPTAIIGMFLLIQRLPAMEAPKSRLAWLLRGLRPFEPLHFLKTCVAMRPLLAIGMVLLVAAPWYIAAGIKTDGEFLREFFFTHNLDRARSSMEGHTGAPWYYPVAISMGFFPWSVFLLPLALETGRRIWTRDEKSAGYIFAACWAGVWVGFFTIFGTKLPSYVTPCYPALALLTGCFIDHLQKGTLLVHRCWQPISLATLCAVGLGIAIGIPLATEKFIPGEAWLGVLGIAPLAAGALALLGWYLQRSAWPAPLMAASGGLLIVGILGLGAYRADLQRQDQQMVVDWVKSSGTESPLSAYRILEPSWVFYSHHSIPQLGAEPQLAAEHFKSHPDSALVTKEQFVPAISRELGEEVIVVTSAPHFLHDGKLVIMRRKPEADGTARRPQGKSF